jgi:uncharacterized protein YkwD
MAYMRNYLLCGVLPLLCAVLCLVCCKTEEAVNADARGETALLGIAGLPEDPCRTALTAEEQKLYDLIMEYRAFYKLPVIPLSPSLSYVAKVHVRDLNAHPPKGSCNMHSWSDDGPWTPCCYTSDHARATCMWYKPRELTSYAGYGYEISMYYSLEVTAEMALATWKTSTGHNNVIINKGKWHDDTWSAIGIGIYKNYAVVWFGKESDPCTK